MTVKFFKTKVNAIFRAKPQSRRERQIVKDLLSFAAWQLGVLARDAFAFDFGTEARPL